LETHREGAAALYNPRYGMIDAWRGLAALAVVLSHLELGPSINVGYMAVMVFFVISGYCIAASADSCLRRGYGFREYMWRRVRRIYPPYFFALCFFAVTRVLKKWSGMGEGLSRDLVAWLQQLTMTQWFSLVTHPKPYPTQNNALFVSAFWSLNYEEQFYLIVGLLLVVSVLTRRSLLGGVAVLMGVGLVWDILHPSTAYGFFVEYWVHFALGVLVFYRLCKIRTPRGRRLIDAFLMVFVTASLVVWIECVRLSVLDDRSVYTEWVVAGGFALVLIALRRWDPWFKKSLMGKGLSGLGAITYSLYLIHQFNLTAAFAVANKLVTHGVPKVFYIPIETGVLVGIATVFWYYCERPFVNQPLTAPASEDSLAYHSAPLPVEG